MSKLEFNIKRNKLESIKHVIVVYIDKKAIGCGAIRKYDKDTIEIKRIFVSENTLEKGIGTRQMYVDNR